MLVRISFPSIVPSDDPSLAFRSFVQPPQRCTGQLGGVPERNTTACMPRSVPVLDDGVISSTFGFLAARGRRCVKIHRREQHVRVSLTLMTRSPSHLPPPTICAGYKMFGNNDDSLSDEACDNGGDVKTRGSAAKFSLPQSFRARAFRSIRGLQNWVCI